MYEDMIILGFTEYIKDDKDAAFFIYLLILFLLWGIYVIIYLLKKLHFELTRLIREVKKTGILPEDFVEKRRAYYQQADDIDEEDKDVDNDP